jgi:hypothetical protein
LFELLKEIESKHSPHGIERDYDREDDDRDHKHARRESPEGDKKRPYNEEEHKRKSNGAHPEEPPTVGSRRRRDDDPSEEERRYRHPKEFGRDERYAPRGNFRYGQHPMMAYDAYLLV